jgi:hypothetical protein
MFHFLLGFKLFPIFLICNQYVIVFYLILGFDRLLPRHFKWERSVRLSLLDISKKRMGIRTLEDIQVGFFSL